MASGKTKDRLDALTQLQSTAPSADVVAVLQKALRDRSNLIVAEAAKVIAGHDLSNLLTDLLEAYERLFDDPVKRDAKCWGKTSIVKALTKFDYTDSSPFVRGSRHVQMEPVWGGQEDSAIHLRAACILALVQCGDMSRTEIFRHLVDAIADAADPVRLEAVRAIAQMNGDEASLLLRLKAKCGDERSVVIGQVFDSLLSLEDEKSIPFVAQYLDRNAVEIRDEAALALGASRLPKAVEILIETWKKNTDQEFRSVLLRALSSSRHESAIDFLLRIVRTGLTRDTSTALDALKLHSDSAEIQSRVAEAQRSRQNGSNFENN